MGRFIVEKSSFAPNAPTEARVKPKLFLPAPSDRKTSVFRHKGLEKAQIWALGKKYFLEPLNETRLVRGESPKALLGRGDLTVAKIKATGLFVEPDNTPPRHASIAGWPPEKSEQKSLAQRLAADAELHLVDDEKELRSEHPD